MKSYAGIVINMLTTLFFGIVFVEVGFKRIAEGHFNHFIYYCGNLIWKIYSVSITVIIFLSMSVLISGAGAALNQYYGINHFAGALLTAIVAAAAYIVGFERLVSITSKISPLVIIFALAIGIITVITDIGQAASIQTAESLITASKTSPNFILSSVLYLSLNFLSGGTYLQADKYTVSDIRIYRPYAACHGRIQGMFG